MEAAIISDPVQTMTTMEVDGGDTTAMDTNDELAGPPVTSTLGSWTAGEAADMTTELPVAPQPCGMAMGQQDMLAEEDESRSPREVWRLAEGVCEKRVVTKGQGLLGPACGACCTATVQVTRSTGPLHPSQLGHAAAGQQGSLHMGEGGTPLSFLVDAALTSMRKGETAEVRLSQVRDVPGEVLLRVTLHDFAEVTPPWRLTPAQKLASAAAHKERGGRRFKDGDVYAAFAQFRSAARLLLSVPPYGFEDDEAAGKSHQQLLLQCYLNLAACQGKAGHHAHVVDNCTQALGIDPASVKARFRRASANASLGNYLLAQEDLEAGLGTEPTNRALLDLLQSIGVKLAPSQVQMAQGLSKMFS